MHLGWGLGLGRQEGPWRLEGELLWVACLKVCRALRGSAALGTEVTASPHKAIFSTPALTFPCLLEEVDFFWRVVLVSLLDRLVRGKGSTFLGLETIEDHSRGGRGPMPHVWGLPPASNAGSPVPSLGALTQVPAQLDSGSPDSLSLLR